MTYIPDAAFLPIASACNGALHLALSKWLATPADIAQGVRAHFATALVFFLGVGVVQHNPYGRYAGAGVLGSSGPSASNQLCWSLQEAPAFCAAAWALWRSGRCGKVLSPRSDPGAFLLFLFAVHYFQRSFVFPFLMRGKKPTQIYVYFSAAGYCGFNGHLMSLALLDKTYAQLHWRDPRFGAGVGIFLFGFLANIHADQHLRSLRDNSKDTGYKIPTAGLFRWISGANFFAEIVEWGGFALAAQHPAALAFFLTVLGNLGPRAMSHHKWYCEKFGDDYTKLRRAALVPYLL